MTFCTMLWDVAFFFRLVTEAQTKFACHFFASVQGVYLGEGKSAQRTKMTCSKIIIYGGPGRSGRAGRSVRAGPPRPGTAGPTTASCRASKTKK
jgi:hypothetical protein